MITAKDLRGVLAIMPTPAKEGADRLDATNTVDLDETARLAESLVHDGATGIMALGKKSTTDEQCSDKLHVCTPEGRDAASSGRTLAVVSTVGWVVGALGIGAGAHSYRSKPDGITGQRWSNENNPAKYMAQVNETSQSIVDHEEIDREKAAGEFMFLGLRMIEGISTEDFRQRFGKSPMDFYPKIESWIEGELLEEKAGSLRFTPKGLMLANSIFVHFM